MCISACRNSAAMWLKLRAFFNQCTRIVTNSRSASNNIQEFTGLVTKRTGLGIARRVVVEGILHNLNLVDLVCREIVIMTAGGCYGSRDCLENRNGYPPASDHSGSDRYMDRCPLNMAGIEIWRR